MGYILMFGGALAFVAGFVCLIKPHWMSLPSRWVAAIIMAVGNLSMTAAGEFYPQKNAELKPGTTADAFWTLVIAVAFVLFVRIAVRARKISRGQGGEDRSGFVEGVAQKWAAAIPAMRERPVKSADPQRASVFSLSGSIPEDKKGDSVASVKATGMLKFKYADARGRVSERSVIHWEEEGNNIHGWCIDQAAERTFRKDHILEWLDRTDQLLRAPASRRRQYTSVEQVGDRVVRLGNSKVHKRNGEPIQGPVSDRLMFEYQNRYGEISYHTLHNWYEYDRHVSGWCTESRADRQFSKKLVVDWLGDARGMLMRA